ncbi:MAG: metallophosphoesterase [Candidatus Thorarchaeota archaeon]
MKALFFSDLHGEQKAITHISTQLAQVDVGFGLGDFATFGKGLTETIEPLDVGTTVYFVPGNHDDAEEMKWICREHDNFYYFHGESVTMNGKTFAGLGGGLPGLPFGLTEEKVQQILKRFYYLEKLILCTHTPPFGTAVDVTWGGNHIGYQSLRDFITEVQPVAVYSGHVHESEGKIDLLGVTELCLVGPNGRVIEI